MALESNWSARPHPNRPIMPAAEFAATDKLFPNNPRIRSSGGSGVARAISLRRFVEGAARRHATDGGAGAARVVENRRVERVEPVALLLPDVLVPHALAASLAHGVPEVCVRSEYRHGPGEIRNRLFRIVRHHLDSCSVGNQLGWASEIEANDWLARRHRFETDPSARIVEARMYQHVAGGERFESVGARL